MNYISSSNSKYLYSAQNKKSHDLFFCPWCKSILFQWLGNEVIHQALEGRLLLIHLLCKHNARRISAPCIALRIAGSPGKIFIKLFTAIAISSQLYMWLLVTFLFNTTLWRMNPMTWKIDNLIEEKIDVKIFTYKHKVFNFPLSFKVWGLVVV